MGRDGDDLHVTNKLGRFQPCPECCFVCACSACLEHYVGGTIPTQLEVVLPEVVDGWLCSECEGFGGTFILECTDTDFWGSGVWGGGACYWEYMLPELGGCNAQRIFARLYQFGDGTWTLDVAIQESLTGATLAYWRVQFESQPLCAIWDALALSGQSVIQCNSVGTTCFVTAL